MTSLTMMVLVLIFAIICVVFSHICDQICVRGCFKVLQPYKQDFECQNEGLCTRKSYFGQTIKVSNSCNNIINSKYFLTNTYLFNSIETTTAY